MKREIIRTHRDKAKLFHANGELRALSSVRTFFLGLAVISSRDKISAHIAFTHRGPFSGKAVTTLCGFPLGDDYRKSVEFDLPKVSQKVRGREK